LPRYRMPCDSALGVAATIDDVEVVGAMGETVVRKR